jgi:hypothetical protein
MAHQREKNEQAGSGKPLGRRQHVRFYSFLFLFLFSFKFVSKAILK